MRMENELIFKIFFNKHNGLKTKCGFELFLCCYQNEKSIDLIITTEGDHNNIVTLIFVDFCYR